MPSAPGAVWGKTATARRIPALRPAPAVSTLRGMFSALLRLEAAGAGKFAAPASPDKGERMFGGQFLAQCLAAAQSTLPEARPTHSLHGYFLRPGDVDLPVSIVVDAVRDGRSFSSREVRAAQKGKELFRSWKRPSSAMKSAS